MVLATLKVQTQQLHLQAEASLGVLEPGLTLPQYVALLQRLLTVYRPLEAQIAALLPATTVQALGLAHAPRSAALRADLTVLGAVVAEPAGPSVRTEGGELSSEAQAWGALYVLEGASLGGMIVGRQLSARLGLSREQGLGFFWGQPESVGPRWRQFGEALSRAQTSRDEVTSPVSATDDFTAQAVQGARRAFELFIRSGATQTQLAVPQLAVPGSADADGQPERGAQERRRRLAPVPLGVPLGTPQNAPPLSPPSAQTGERR